MAAFAFIAAAASQAMAQAEPSYPPLAKEFPVGYEMTSGSLPSVLGVSPGMTIAEVDALIAPTSLPGELAYRDEIQSVSDPSNGAESAFLYRSAVATRLTPAVEGSMDRLSVYFTTALTGSRVKGIERNLDYTSTPLDLIPNFDKTIDAIIAAYGEPSFRKEAGAGVFLYYIYRDGALAAPGGEDLLIQCQSVKSAIFYAFEQDRVDNYPDCTALVQVTANRHYESTKSLLTLEIEVSDYRRAFDDAVIADQYVLDGLAADGGANDGPDVKL